jgi:hypothetical protein
MSRFDKNGAKRIFISHAWEDKSLARHLEDKLRATGAEVWIDHVGIRGGDNLPEQISEALEWCNTLLLLWSNAACQSRWVNLEWTNGIALEKRIIPCSVDGTKLPAILANKAYIDFGDLNEGVGKLLHALNLKSNILKPKRLKSYSSVPRKKRNKETEKIIKTSLGNILQSQWGGFVTKNSQLFFPDNNKKVLLVYSSFQENAKKWFWGVSGKYWKNWTSDDYLALVFEDQNRETYSFILLNASQAKSLFEKCSENAEAKKINARIYKSDNKPHLQEWVEFDFEKNVRELPLENIIHLNKDDPS